MHLTFPEPKEDSLALYVHWPWCLKKCPYCDFNSHVAASDETEAYTDALIADMHKQSQLITKRKLISIFFGGGTPSLMKPHQIERILTASRELFNWDDNIEITLESNPTSSTLNKFKDFKRVGINRVSIGVQSLHNEYLSFLGREHSSMEALNTIENANLVFNNVNIDLIYGLPDQDIKLWDGDLQQISRLGTTHVSAYQLTIEPNTKFFGEVKKGKWIPLEEDLQADFYNTTKSVLKSHNIDQYEISNFSKNEYNCKHNTHIWQYGDYMGIGAGAHGRLFTKENIRVSTQNYKVPSKYIDSVKHVEHSMYRSSIIPDIQEQQERLLMGLRLCQGVHINERMKNHINFQALEKFINLNLLQIGNSKVKATEKGLIILDYILSDIAI